jgi:hypothetical protein
LLEGADQISAPFYVGSPALQTEVIVWQFCLWNWPGGDIFGTLAIPQRFNLERRDLKDRRKEVDMNGIVYLVGLVVIVLAILSFLGLR